MNQLIPYTHHYINYASEYHSAYILLEGAKFGLSNPNKVDFGRI